MADIEQDRAELHRLRMAVNMARSQFQFYADEHTRAGKAEKAATNQRFADALKAALAPHDAGGGDAGKVFSAPLDDIAAERRRQVDVEGWTAEHDDKHTHGDLAKAATCYASVFPLAASYWPWDLKWWKPTSRRRSLVKAGALIVAEIERLDRAEAAVLALAGAGE